MSKDMLGSVVRAAIGVPQTRLDLLAKMASKLAADNPDGDAWHTHFSAAHKVGPAKAEPELESQKFTLLADLGTITVPEDYNHATQLVTFRKKNYTRFYYYNDDITDANFGNPSRILKPGNKLRVRAFKQVVGGTTTSEERMAFLGTQKAVHTGAQGASLIFEQKRDKLPKGYWYASFDEKNRLWEDVVGSRRVPIVNALSDGDFHFDLAHFGRDWYYRRIFFCFCDAK